MDNLTVAGVIGETNFVIGTREQIKTYPRQAYVFYAELNGIIKPLFAVSATCQLTIASAFAEDAIRAGGWV